MDIIKSVKAHLADNSGDENVSKLIWIVIAFIVGAALLAILSGAFAKDGAIDTWLDATMQKWFPAAGENAPTRPAV